MLEKKTASIAPFNLIFWAVLLACWTEIAFLYTWKVYPAPGPSFFLAFFSVELRALLAMALTVALGALFQRRLGRLGELLPPAAFLVLTALHQIGAIGFYFLEQPLSSILNYLSSDKKMGLWAMLENAGLSNRALAGFVTGLFAIVALGLAFLLLSQRAAERRQWRVRWTTFAGSCFAAVLLILAEQFLSSRIKNPEAWHQEQLTSPLYVAAMSPHGYETFAAKLVPPREDLGKQIEALPRTPGSASKDSIAILIVLESFRSDAVDPAVSPNLYRFQQENLSFPRAFSGGNATGAAWLAIVDGEYPIFAYPGSPALLLLKKAGFRNSVFASAGIDYSAFRSEAFGPGEKIAEMFLGPGLYEPESDASSTHRMLQDIAAHRAKGPNLHILFLNASHAHYRWPANYEAKFKPYLALGPQDRAAFVGDSGEALLRYRNRYKNSVNFIDSLFGSIVTDLKARGLYRNAVIVVVGDHGQEFMEHGTLAHGTNLFNPQIHIPLLMKLPGIRKPSTSALATQLDIMPTLLDYFGLGREADSILAGRSLLREQKEDRAVLTKNVGPSTHKKQVWALSTDRYKFEFTVPLGSGTLPLIVWRVSDSDDHPFIPGKGTPADYRAFLAREFVPRLNKSGAFTVEAK